MFHVLHEIESFAIHIHKHGQLAGNKSQDS